MKKIIIVLLFIVTGSVALAQTFAEGDCQNATGGCDIPDFVLTGSNPTGQGNNQFNDLPGGLNISNPSTNPGTAGNSGCLFSNELNPVWMIFTVTSPGQLEFMIGGPGSNGFFDWSLWPYYEDPAAGTSACNDITNNTLPPAACNWNASSTGWTGMVAPGNLPAGANAGNFENALNVQAGDQFVLCFSNYSSIGSPGNPVPVSVTTGANIPGTTNTSNTATIDCSGETYTFDICLGELVDVNINITNYNNPTYTWLNGAGDVDDPAAGPDFIVTTPVSNTYYVEVTDGTDTDTFEVIINVTNPPNPDAGPDFTVCSGQPASIMGSVDDPSNTINWSFIAPPGLPGPPSVQFSPSLSSPTPNVTTNYDGTYQFILSEDNALCPIDRDTVLVTFSNGIINPVGVDPLCNGSADGEIHIGSPDAVQYSFDAGTTWQVDSFAVGYSAGTYNVCIENSLGCIQCDDITLTDPALIEVFASNDTLICENGTASLVAWATGGNNYNFLWDHTADQSANQTENPLMGTTYTVQAESDNGCLSGTEDIIVSMNPSIAGTISPTQTICPGYPTMVTANGTDGDGGPYNYSWTDEAGNVVATTNTFSANPMTTTTYTCTITDGCESTPLVLQAEVVVAPLPDVQFTVDVNELCEPARFRFTNTTDPALSQDAYWWFSNGTTIGLSDVVDVNIEYAGFYDAQLIVVSPEGCIDSLTQLNMVTVHPKPHAKYNSAPSPVLMFNTEVQFSDYSQGADNVIWTFEQGTPGFSTLSNPISNFPEGVPGNYLVTLEAISEHGCRDTVNGVVQVVPEVIIYAPNAFTPDGDEFNQNWGIHIEGIDVYDFDLEIFDRWGERIWLSHDADATWDGTYGGVICKAGTYVWKLRTKDMVTDRKYEYQGHLTIIR